MILIYAPEDSPRLSYILDVMVESLMGEKYELTHDRARYIQYDGPKFSYGEDLKQGLYFASCSLLFEHDIVKQEVVEVDWKEYHVFYPVTEGVFPFDPFAFSFYLISRYEEYFSDAKKDKHDRFDITCSAAYQLGFYRKPLVNIIAMEIKTLLQATFKGLDKPKNRFSVVNTYDVDIAYQYKGKGFLRFLASLVKSTATGNFAKSGKLLKTAVGIPLYDSFDTFAQHKEQVHQGEAPAIHFILTAPFGKYDRNINPDTTAFKELVVFLETFSEIGLHPSYYSKDTLTLIGKEKKRLEKACSAPIYKTRQHFLRFDFPTTFNELINQGFTDDYSLGWTNDVGFRASIASPFLFYDLSKECKTSLMLHPLAIMDSALAHAAPTRELQEELLQMIVEEVKQVGGELILLRHNSFPDLF